MEPSRRLLGSGDAWVQEGIEGGKLKAFRILIFSALVGKLVPEPASRECLFPGRPGRNLSISPKGVMRDAGTIFTMGLDTIPLLGSRNHSI